MVRINYTHCAQLLKALAHPTRLNIVALIKEEQPCVKALEEVLGVSQSNISQHLSLLRHLGIVRARREGNQVCYRLSDDTVSKMLDVLSNSINQKESENGKSD